MKSYNIIFILVIIVLSSCATSVAVDGIVGISESPIQISDFYKNANILALYEDSTKVIENASIVHHENGNFYLLDDKFEHIVSFDSKGNWKNSFFKKGNSSNEYIRILDFDVDKDKVYILCSPNKIFVLNEKLEFQYKLDVPEMSSRISVKDDNIYIYSEKDRTISVLVDGQWEELLKEGVLPACPKLGAPTFFKTNKSLFYCAEGSRHIYRISEKNISHFFSFDYPNRQHVEERLAENKILDISERFTMSPPSIRSILENDSCLLVTYSYGGIYRACTIDNNGEKLILDGYWYGNMSFPKNQYLNGYVTTSYISLEDIPIDTTIIKINYLNTIKKDGNLSIINYQ